MSPDLRRRLGQRVEDQSHDHWHEFSVIVASANVLFAVLLAGRIVTAHRHGAVLALAVCIGVAAGTAAILAYYSIQVGALLIFGPLRLADVLLSFGVAASQLALFLWPTHVLNATGDADTAVFRGLRHALLAFFAFAVFAVLTNRHAARARRSPPAAADLEFFERRQQTDARIAGLAGAAILICWALSWRWLTGPTFAGVALAVAGQTVGVLSQAKVAGGLARVPTTEPELP